MDITKTITHLSLCSGYGGIGEGLKRVLPTLRDIAHVEIEAFAVANLVAKMESKQMDAAPIYTDVKTFPYEVFRGCVDILSGGFPCQPFSTAGARQGVEDPRHLYPYISRGIEQCRPRIVFLENVEGIISSKTHEGESVLKYVLSDLERMGYRATAGIFSASEVGFPHQRKRIFILGYSEQSGPQGHNEHSTSEYREDKRSIVGARGSCGTTEKLVESNDNGYNENRRRNKEENRISEEHRSEVCGGLSNRTSEELGNSKHNGHTSCSQSRSFSKSEEERRMQESERRSNKLSDTNNERLERWNSRDLQECTNQQSFRPRDTQVPSRPNEPQYEWEEPRVKPQLGRAANGSSSRVDRLRLLGNGVVPQTAEKAFITLLGRL